MWWYVGPAIATQMLAPLAMWRRGDPPSTAAWWLIVWPVGLMWPLFVFDLLAHVVDGPREPRHRSGVW
jgi:hypothetical protein